MAQSVIRLATVSDIHLGHPSTPAHFIIHNFDEVFFKDPENQHLDILFLAGDLFDRMLYLSQDEVMEIIAWGAKLLRFCAIHRIILRILEGTPSHDRNQSKLFDTIRQELGIDVNYNYIKNISIEYIEPLDIHVLYVPDQPSISPDTVLATVDELMEARGIAQVDYAIMHGHFKHQLPAVVKHPAHDARSYLNRVKYLIFIGHVHTASVFERIFAEGSFDRTAQGQEEAKGYYRAKVDVDGTYEATFVENRGAQIYRTIDLTSETLETSIPLVREIVSTLPVGSRIRLTMNREHPWASNLHELRQQYTLHHWDRLLVGTNVAKEVAETDISPEFSAVILNKDTLPSAVMARIERHRTLDPKLRQAIENHLEQPRKPL